MRPIKTTLDGKALINKICKDPRKHSVKPEMIRVSRGFANNGKAIL